MSNPPEVTTDLVPPERADAAPAEQREAEPAVAAAGSSPAWSRGHLVWMLIALALVPAGLISLLPGGWQRLPAALQWSFIVLSAIVTLAVSWLILRDDADQTS